jgi:hypothetical protein
MPHRLFPPMISLPNLGLQSLVCASANPSTTKCVGLDILFRNEQPWLPGVALTLGAQEKTVSNAAADDSSSEEVIIRRKPIPKPAVNQVSSSSEEESEQVRAASLGLRVRAKVNYKEKGEKDIFKSDDEEMVSAPMQVISRDRSVAAVFDCLALIIDCLNHSLSRH